MYDCDALVDVAVWENELSLLHSLLHALLQRASLRILSLSG
jgi:hypothetical protein